MGKPTNTLRIASRYGPHEAHGCFAIVGLVVIRVLLWAGLPGSLALLAVWAGP